jgi:hypothetical protein
VTSLSVSCSRREGFEEAAMECMSTMLVKLEHQKRQKLHPPYLARQMLKWFYNTSTGTATRAARCDSLVGEGLGLSDVSYGGTRWRRKIYVVWAAGV